MNAATEEIPVPITVRTLAARSLAASRLVRSGGIECDARPLRERAVNWLALALLLAAWNVEARLTGPSPQSALGSTSPDTAGWPPGGFDWTEPRVTKWTSCAAQDPCRRGA